MLSLLKRALDSSKTPTKMSTDAATDRASASPLLLLLPPTLTNLRRFTAHVRWVVFVASHRVLFDTSSRILIFENANDKSVLDKYAFDRGLPPAVHNPRLFETHDANQRQLVEAADSDAQTLPEMFGSKSSDDDEYVKTHTVPASSPSRPSRECCSLGSEGQHSLESEGVSTYKDPITQTTRTADVYAVFDSKWYTSSSMVGRRLEQSPDKSWGLKTISWEGPAHQIEQIRRAGRGVLRVQLKDVHSNRVSYLTCFHLCGRFFASTRHGIEDAVEEVVSNGAVAYYAKKAGWEITLFGDKMHWWNKPKGFPVTVVLALGPQTNSPGDFSVFEADISEDDWRSMPQFVPHAVRDWKEIGEIASFGFNGEVNPKTKSDELHLDAPLMHAYRNSRLTIDTLNEYLNSNHLAISITSSADASSLTSPSAVLSAKYASWPGHSGGPVLVLTDLFDHQTVNFIGIHYGFKLAVNRSTLALHPDFLAAYGQAYDRSHPRLRMALIPSPLPPMSPAALCSPALSTPSASGTSFGCSHINER